MKHRSFFRTASWLSVVLLVPALAPAATTPSVGTIAGRVTGRDGAPALDAEVHLVTLGRRVGVDEQGAFTFTAVPVGSYWIEARSPRLGSSLQQVAVGEGRNEVTLTLDVSPLRETIVVTAGEARAQSELAVSTSVVDGEELSRRLRPTLGETLSHEAGVSSTFFGPGASRPVIRGLGGDRIRVLETGLGTGDASTTSPDHAVSLDPLAADRIEIIRGPATLLYGSSAVGGVVNVIDGRIPSLVPAERLSGQVDVRGSSNADEAAGSLRLDGGHGGFAWHFDGLKRETSDYRSGEGTVVNSALETAGGSGGVSWVGKDAYLGVAASRFDTVYGSPAEEEVEVDLAQRRYDLEGELHRELAAWDRFRLRFGKTDYEHVELEGDEVGTRFLNDSWEGRLEASQRRVGPLSGSLGLQIGRRDFSALGEESFVPRTLTRGWALFTLQELGTGAWRTQLGLRYESQTIDADVDQGLDRRELSGVSGSLGVVWLPGETYGASLSVSRSVKLPNAEELFSNGPHLATAAFEIGDPTLDRETNLGAELSLRKRAGRLTGELSIFRHRFDGFIYERLTGEEVEGEEEPLRVIRFSQSDADLHGAELSGALELVHRDPHHLDLEFGADFVRAELREGAGALPRIPPRRYRLGLRYRGDRLSAEVEGVRADAQDRVAELETPTPGYTLVNAGVGYRLLGTRVVYDLLLRGTNLTDELALNHVSFLKDLAPLPGRDVTLSLRASF